MPHSFSVRLLLLLVATAPCLGCGDDRPTPVRVAGQVLIDGQPLTYGIVRFVPQDARPSTGEIDDQGKFQLSCFADGDGAITGVHRVEVIAAREISASEMQWLAPEHYSRADSSQLVVEINEPRDDVIIELTWNGMK